MSFVSGPYDWTYNSSPLGVVAEPPRVRFAFSAEEVRGDNLGDTIQALINRGGSMYLDMVFQEWDLAAVQALAWPFSATRGAMGTAAGAAPGFAAIGCPIGGANLVGTATANSCATPKTWTFYNVVLAPNFDVSYLLGSRLRSLPLSLLVRGQVVSGAYDAETNPLGGHFRWYTAA